MKNILKKIKRFILKEKNKIETPVDKWFKDNGDSTLRISYPDLRQDPVIFDLGGYQGQWSSDIYSALGCARIYIFEPVEKNFCFIKNRFQSNTKIKSYQFGLGSREVDSEIYLDENCSSTFHNSKDGVFEKISIKAFDAFLKEMNISEIDLLKINIEGGEFELLEWLLETGNIRCVRHLQVQFHDFIPNAKERRERIRNMLESTHSETWCYDFVWENWKRRE